MGDNWAALETVLSCKNSRSPECEIVAALYNFEQKLRASQDFDSIESLLFKILALKNWRLGVICCLRIGECLASISDMSGQSRLFNIINNLNGGFKPSLVIAAAQVIRRCGQNSKHLIVSFLTTLLKAGDSDPLPLLYAVVCSLTVTNGELSGENERILNYAKKGLKSKTENIVLLSLQTLVLLVTKNKLSPQKSLTLLYGFIDTSTDSLYLKRACNAIASIAIFICKPDAASSSSDDNEWNEQKGSNSKTKLSQGLDAIAASPAIEQTFAFFLEHLTPDLYSEAFQELFSFVLKNTPQSLKKLFKPFEYENNQAYFQRLSSHRDISYAQFIVLSELAYNHQSSTDLAAIALDIIGRNPFPQKVVICHSFRSLAEQDKKLAFEYLKGAVLQLAIPPEGSYDALGLGLMAFTLIPYCQTNGLEETIQTFIQNSFTKRKFLGIEQQAALLVMSVVSTDLFDCDLVSNWLDQFIASNQVKDEYFMDSLFYFLMNHTFFPQIPTLLKMFFASRPTATKMYILACLSLSRKALSWDPFLDQFLRFLLDELNNYSFHNEQVEHLTDSNSTNKQWSNLRIFNLSNEVFIREIVKTIPEAIASIENPSGILKILRQHRPIYSAIILQLVKFKSIIPADYVDGLLQDLLFKTMPVVCQKLLSESILLYALKNPQLAAKLLANIEGTHSHAKCHLLSSMCYHLPLDDAMVNKILNELNLMVAETANQNAALDALSSLIYLYGNVLGSSSNIPMTVTLLLDVLNMPSTQCFTLRKAADCFINLIPVIVAEADGILQAKTNLLIQIFSIPYLIEMEDIPFKILSTVTLFPGLFTITHPNISETGQSIETQLAKFKCLQTMIEMGHSIPQLFDFINPAIYLYQLTHDQKVLSFISSVAASMTTQPSSANDWVTLIKQIITQNSLNCFTQSVTPSKELKIILIDAAQYIVPILASRKTLEIGCLDDLVTAASRPTVIEHSYPFFVLVIKYFGQNKTDTDEYLLAIYELQFTLVVKSALSTNSPSGLQFVDTLVNFLAETNQTFCLQAIYDGLTDLSCGLPLKIVIASKIDRLKHLAPSLRFELQTSSQEILHQLIDVWSRDPPDYKAIQEFRSTYSIGFLEIATSAFLYADKETIDVDRFVSFVNSLFNRKEEPWLFEGCFNATGKCLTHVTNDEKLLVFLEKFVPFATKYPKQAQMIFDESSKLPNAAKSALDLVEQGFYSPKGIAHLLKCADQTLLSDHLSSIKNIICTCPYLGFLYLQRFPSEYKHLLASSKGSKELLFVVLMSYTEGSVELSDILESFGEEVFDVVWWTLNLRPELSGELIGEQEAQALANKVDSAKSLVFLSSLKGIRWQKALLFAAFVTFRKHKEDNAYLEAFVYFMRTIVATHPDLLNEFFDSYEHKSEIVDAFEAKIGPKKSVVTLKTFSSSRKKRRNEDDEWMDLESFDD